mgnify:CR=1 FL=1
MNDIIRMAREAGFEPFESLNGRLLAFAALVAAATIKDAPDYKIGYADGVAIEREACAKVAETLEWSDHKGIASAIRARGQE